ncbi:DUF2188 domain-containing protein [Virgibacillus sp. NKC19-3]|uniref:DUF2188 domain-containing protein n=1 Tax=Virgibacillus saliphilus TaxID=2831674 RepID=UPI001C9B9329|nr:DUF2188 domain-containing protein [Virgibacillus sp. NKC19-3]MBY7142225.1 DUF2188 domain-containing protein [Virgibacillus sp. NKC19-3]
MPWTLNDYPSSMKNLDEATKKKAIDIANSMIDEGYEEGRAIPIATEQAKEWYQNASEDEIETYKKRGKPTQRAEEGKRYENNPERLEEAEEVVAHENGWAVQSSNADRASDIFENKDEAINRGREIAKNKGTSLIIYKQDGSIQERYSYKDN